MIERFKSACVGQLEASVCMIGECIEKCPAGLWDAPIGKYPFWQVAYHALCFVDVYLSRDNDAWQPQTGPGGIHPAGRAELDEEYPSRRFEPRELLGYVAFCRQKISAELAAETEATLAGRSGFSHLPIPRAELHLYNLRHAQHHAGQLTAFLHKSGVPTRWVKTGWR